MSSKHGEITVNITVIVALSALIPITKDSSALAQDGLPG
jgi:hypothetical protein